MQNIRKVLRAMHSLGDSLEQSFGRYEDLLQGSTNSPFSFVESLKSVVQYKGIGITVQV
jgi:hypothetical protein